MKRFLLIALSTGLLLPNSAEAFWGKYPSKNQAFQACLKWERAGGTYQNWEDLAAYNVPAQYGYKTTNRRICRLENETNQFLGFEKRIRRGGKAPKNRNLDSEVKKNFRF
tara:strand:- start:636 stop:965 length:330 start_codon:yes stop_codon:yes gene_type:complete